MAGGDERPRMSTYRTPEKRRADGAAAGRQRVEAAAQAGLVRQRSVKRIVAAGLPLLRKHVELSPIEVKKNYSTGIFTKRYHTKIVDVFGGWPLQTVHINVPGGMFGDQTAVYYFVATEDARIGFAVNDITDTVYTMSDPPRLYKLEHLERCEAEHPRHPSVTPKGVTAGIMQLLGEVGVEFSPG